jgi:hypothetical protein
METLSACRSSSTTVTPLTQGVMSRPSIFTW